MVEKIKYTTTAIPKNKLDYLTDLQYVLKKKIGLNWLPSKKLIVMLIIDYIEHNEDSFVEYVKNNLNKLKKNQ